MQPQRPGGAHRRRPLLHVVCRRGGGVGSVLEGVVALGVLAEVGEVVVEGGEVEVEHVDAVAEVLEPELGPGSVERGDGLLPLGRSSCVVSGWLLVSSSIGAG
jgi:hypothetical protein